MSKYLLTATTCITDYTEPNETPHIYNRTLGTYDTIDECYKKANEDLRQFAQEQEDPYGTILDPNDDSYDADEADEVIKNIERYIKNKVEIKIIGELTVNDSKTILMNVYDYGDSVDQISYSVVKFIDYEKTELKIGDQVFKIPGSPMGKKGYTIINIEGTKATILGWSDTVPEVIDIANLKLAQKGGVTNV